MLRAHDSAADAFLTGVTETIANRLRPSRVILFGSRARGGAHAASDYDLLVEMEADLPRTGRVAAVYAAFDERPSNLDVLVLTPDEYEQQRDDVGTTAYAIHREGRVLYAAIGTGPEPREGVRVRERRRGVPASLRWWLRRAENDLRAMDQLLVARDPVPDATWFHAHQAAEKLLKSALIAATTERARGDDAALTAPWQHARRRLSSPGRPAHQRLSGAIFRGDMRRSRPMRLDLSAEDAATLRALLHDYLPSLRREVARTEKREIRHEMERRQEVVERVLAELGEPVEA